MTHIKRKIVVKILCYKNKIYLSLHFIMIVKIEINIVHFEVRNIQEIHIKRVKNTIVMHKNNSEMGSA